MSDSEYIREVLNKLSSNPTQQDLDFLVEAYTRVGYIAATARGNAERAEAERKFAYATAFASAKSNGAKTSSDAESSATSDTREHLLAEIRAREIATKVSNLLASIEQTINAIKFLGRATESTMSLPRR